MVSDIKIFKQVGIETCRLDLTYFSLYAEDLLPEKNTTRIAAIRFVLTSTYVRFLVFQSEISAFRVMTLLSFLFSFPDFHPVKCILESEASK